MNAAKDNGELRELPGPLLIGAGKMGGALLEGWLNSGLDPTRIAVVEPQPAPAIALSGEAFSQPEPSAQLAGTAAIVIAVKPQAAAEALPATGRCRCSDTSCCRSWPAGLCNCSLTGCRLAARWCARCPICRRPSARESRLRWRRAQMRSNASWQIASYPLPARSNGSKMKRLWMR